ncbi:GNAT family N-acetyltransferase [Hymenobacter metallicola]|uniref:GNAT family N-acetyltransferase n=1 Tax=Hymenobacter metallicola TaxID=2563114 RepID=A0A4Z0PZF4_9BACT|nr:GNAT family N-acetyltransferase [Hymenobacter metallicola]TGE22815.1 GNAT family N-acetyltransferase [Hymenobacter metallicola]
MDLCPNRPSFLTIYKWSELLSEIDSSKMLYLFAHAPSQLAPVAMLRLDMTEPAGWISSLWVHPEHRKRGLASSLISRAVVNCKERSLQTIGLTVHNDNADARKLYERRGFLQYINSHEGYTQLVKVL